MVPFVAIFRINVCQAGHVLQDVPLVELVSEAVDPLRVLRDRPHEPQHLVQVLRYLSEMALYVVDHHPLFENERLELAGVHRRRRYGGSGGLGKKCLPRGVCHDDRRLLINVSIHKLTLSVDSARVFVFAHTKIYPVLCVDHVFIDSKRV